MKIKDIIVSLVGLAATVPAIAASPMLNARLDSTTMLMGNVTTLHLEVVQDKNTKGNFPLFEKFGPEGIVTLLNDTIELGRPSSVDTVEVGTGRIQINYEVPVQVFDSGSYRLPPFIFAAGHDTVRSKELQLSVVPVNVTADDQISPFTDVAEPENPSIFDKMPDWLYYYWWLYLLAIGIIVAAFFLWKIYRKRGSILPAKPRKTPYEQAIESLHRLKERKLWESGREKEYYTELTEILRKYLDGRFGIQAMEMTSKEIMSHLADLGDHNIPRDKMRDVLDMADFVKFAMVRPLPDDNVALYKNAVDFVESTRPSAVDDDMHKSESETTAKGNADTHTHSNLREDSEDSSNFKGVGRRGRMARLDKVHDRISADRLKVGKKINRREASGASDISSAKDGKHNRREVKR